LRSKGFTIARPLHNFLCKLSRTVDNGTSGLLFRFDHENCGVGREILAILSMRG
jgi:hypothetical protein